MRLDMVVLPGSSIPFITIITADPAPLSPGRFFAIVELKLMMAHLLINYDVALQSGAYPPKLCFETLVIPSRTESILYRKRQN